MDFSFLSSVITPVKAFIKKRRSLPAFSYQLNSQLTQSSIINIIYILHAYKHKAGGDKIAYQQSQIINQHFTNQASGYVLHPQNVNFEHHWFEHQVVFKKNLYLNPQQDFVVIPEIWAAPHAQMLHKLGIKYAIFVQNGYSIHIPLCSNTAEDIQFAYENATVILSISDDTSACISLAFPTCTAKIQRIYCSVDANKFKSSTKKENLITYMPRKLRNHSSLVMSFIESELKSTPARSNWKIQAIDGLNESGVVAMLQRSKIFLSFSEFEGLGLPPIEAALSGNFVIGYTGEAGKEYWQPPLFTEIPSGDIRAYVKQILLKIDDLNQADAQVDTEKLRQKYSMMNEINSLQQFVLKVTQALAQ